MIAVDIYSFLHRLMADSISQFRGGHLQLSQSDAAAVHRFCFC